MTSPAAKEAAADPTGPEPEQATASEEEETGQEAPQAPTEPPQNAWDAAQELFEHAPESFTSQGSFFAGGAPRFGGSLIHGDQHTVSGGQVHGDVVTGQKTTIYQLGAAFGSPLHESGEVPADELTALAAVFQDGPEFAIALAELRSSHLLILRGGQDTGRRAAGLMLLHRLGARRIRALSPEVSPASLLKGVEPADGYLLSDLATPRSRPLTPLHLLQIREALTRLRSKLVITIAEHPVPADIRSVHWTAPDPVAVLTAHLMPRLADTAADGIAELLQLEPVAEFLAKDRPVREIADFAGPLAEYAAGHSDLTALSAFGQAAVREQVGRWFGAPDIKLREKSFLLALSVFHQAPYALTAELSDQLFRRLEAIEAPGRKEGIPPFGGSIEERLALARAQQYQENEQTPWGPVPQRMAAFVDPRTPHTLFREVWTSHPSARPAVIAWLHDLAADPRPLVRTRAASTTALLASVDLSSAMGRLLGPWSGAKDFRLCLQAANSLALAYYAGTAAVPRILHDWCGDDDPHRRWTAVRGYALLGHLLPEQSLEAMRVAAGRLDADELTDLTATIEAADPTRLPDQPASFQATGLVEAIELLLLSPAGPTTLVALTEWTTDVPQLRQVALAAFLSAARRTDGDQDDPLGWPLLLRWYSVSPTAAPGEAVSVTELPGPDPLLAIRPRLATLWRTALADRALGSAALRALRRWLHAAQADPEIEEQLSGLLGSLSLTEHDRRRLNHLLRTLRGSAAAEPSAVDRMLAAVGTP